MAFNLTIMTFTNSTGTIIQVVVQNTPPELSGWTTTPSRVLLATRTLLLFSPDQANALATQHHRAGRSAFPKHILQNLHGSLRRMSRCSILLKPGTRHIHFFQLGLQKVL